MQPTHTQPTHTQSTENKPKQAKYTFSHEALVNKDWAAGTINQMTYNEHVIRYNDGVWSSEYAKVTYAPAWLKMIDEPLVNAVDQFVNTIDTSHPVTVIKVNFTEDTGLVRIYNNGRGIDTSVHEEASRVHGRIVYNPTFLFERDQTNNRTKSPESITGGQNGIGGKLPLCFSTDSLLETVCDGMYFLQKWKPHMSGVHDPTVQPITKMRDLPPDRAVEHTIIRFQPDYCGDKTTTSDVMFYKRGFGYDKFDKIVYDSLVDIVRTRVVYASLYCKYTHSLLPRNSKRKIDVYFNDVLIPFTSMQHLAAMMFPGCHTIPIVVYPNISVNPLYKYPWEIVIVLTNTTRKQRMTSQVNGVVCKGGHVDYIRSQLIDGVIQHMGKICKDKNLKLSSDSVSNNMYLFLNTKIPFDGIAWSGQRKDVLDINHDKLAGYVIAPKIIKEITDHLKDILLEKIQNKVTRKKKITYEKYRKATAAGGSESHKCGLIITEGDSAMSQIITGVSANKQLNGFQYLGIMSTGGNIINVKRKTVIHQTESGRVLSQNKQLEDNKFIQALTQILGVDYKHSYDPSDINYDKQRGKLNYGYVIIAPDQDLDGKGKILGLLMTFFQTNWPHLYNVGFVRWFQSDIIRLYPKSKSGPVLSFKSLVDYHNTITTINIDKYETKYYKGWATHSKEETAMMFDDMNSRVYTFNVDDDSDRLYDIYYGDVSNARKEVLSQHPYTLSIDTYNNQEKTHTISCSAHLRTEVDMFQRSDLEQKLINVMDGCNQSSRKILAGVIKHFKTNKDISVERLGGSITQLMGYDHGGDSLCDSVVRKGVIITGGIQLPIIVPDSMFGSRFGDDAGKPRYIKCKLNSRLVSILYPPVDHCLLEYHNDEMNNEPKHFLPIIPTAGLESMNMPSHGWAYTIWARDVFDVIQQTRRCILRNSVEFSSTEDLSLCTYEHTTHPWIGAVSAITGTLCSYGVYELASDNKVIITELPLRTWTRKYLSDLSEKLTTTPDLIADVENDIVDKSDGDTIHIEITFIDGAIDRVLNTSDEYYDGMTELLKLRASLKSNINMMGVNKEVLSFKRYCEVFQHWFPARKELYAKRFHRERVLRELKIELQQNTVRYIADPDKVTRGSKSVMITYLAKAEYVRFNKHIVDKPKRMPTDVIRYKATHENATYDYLLNLTVSNISDENLADQQAKLSKMIDDLAEYVKNGTNTTFINKKVWLDEIDQLEVVIRHGFKTNWKYD